MLKILRNVLFVTLVSIFSFSSAQAMGVNSSIPESDSMRRYNALENKVSFHDFLNNIRKKIKAENFIHR